MPEIGVIIVKLGEAEVVIADGDRIAQLVVAPVLRGVVNLVEKLDETGRNAGGFGHTGVNGRT